MRPIVLLLLLAAAAGEAFAQPTLTHSALELPGAPAQVTPVEIDGDPVPELAAVVVYTTWREMTVEESSSIDEVAGLVAVMTIVPALLERRELWLLDRGADGGWEPLAQPLELDTDVLGLEATKHPALPLLALTDDGVDALRWSGGATPTLRREPIARARTAFAGTGAFLPRLRWVHDLDGDPWPDLLLPVGEGWQVRRGTAEGFADAPAAVLPFPPFDGVETPWRLDLPLPEVRDVDGDGLADVVVPHPTRGWAVSWVYGNRGDGLFAGPTGPLGDPEGDDEEDDEAPTIVFFDDLDGDGTAEFLVREEIALPDDAGLRREMGHAKRPPFRYAVTAAGPGLVPSERPRLEFIAEGYSFPGDDSVHVPGGLWDLDGDGRRDLVTVTLDFSMLQAMKVLVTQRISLGLDFHVHCQQPDGSFRLVEGLDLAGRVRVDLDDFRLRELSLFAGDFDGDGRRDFVQVGRGAELSIHRGRAGCRFPAEPDQRLRLAEEPQDLALLDVADLDGDGLADLSVVQSLARGDGSVRLDLYLSGGRP